MTRYRFLLLLLLSQFAFAQSTTGKIKPVKTAGLHKILLPPDVRSFSKDDLSDFRIYDSKKNEVPYFVVQADRHIVSRDVEQYPIIDKKSIPKKSTTYIIEVFPAKKLNSIALEISNSDMTKTYDLIGSNDKSQWFGISNNATLSQLSSNDKTTVTKTISFPLSDYRYLKFVFNDSLTLPINVISAKNSWDQIRQSQLQAIVPLSIESEQLKEQKITIIHVEFGNPQVIDQISFDVAAPRYFKRPVSIYRSATRKVKRKNISYNDYICEFELSSTDKKTFEVPQLFVHELEIEIGNKDNQPLEIANISFGQLPVYIVADLEADKAYTFKTGSPKLHTPQYDIAEVTDRDLNTLPQATISDIKHSEGVFGIHRRGSFWQQPWFMWVCIAIGGLAIIYFTMRLIKDMK